MSARFLSARFLSARFLSARFLSARFRAPRFLLPGLLILGAPLLAGCQVTDPYSRSGAWQPTGANARNLAAMVQRPNDLVRGRGTAGSDGAEAAPPVARLLANRPTPLPASATQSGPSGPAAPPPAAGAP